MAERPLVFIGGPWHGQMRAVAEPIVRVHVKDADPLSPSYTTHEYFEQAWPPETEHDRPRAIMVHRTLPLSEAYWLVRAMKGSDDAEVEGSDDD